MNRTSVLSLAWRSDRVTPASYFVHDAGSGGRFADCNSATRSLHSVIPRVHSIRSAITIADAHQVQRKLLADLRLHRIHDRPK